MGPPDSLTQEERYAAYWSTCPADELARALVNSENEVCRLRALLAENTKEHAAKVDATLRLAANVCDDFAQRAKTDREKAINREDVATLARAQSTAMACRDAILALLGEQGRK